MISDASPLIIFGKINRLELLIKLFGQIEIVESVYDEVVRKGKELNKPEALTIEEKIKEGKIVIAKLDKSGKEKSAFLMRAYSKLDNGEADTIILALQKKQKKLLIDERIARKVAEIQGLLPIGSLGIILLAYEKKLINEEDTKQIIDILISGNFRVGAEVISEFWRIFNRIKG